MSDELTLRIVNESTSEQQTQENVAENVSDNENDSIGSPQIRREGDIPSFTAGVNETESASYISDPHPATRMDNLIALFESFGSNTLLPPEDTPALPGTTRAERIISERRPDDYPEQIHRSPDTAREDEISKNKAKQFERTGAIPRQPTRIRKSERTAKFIAGTSENVLTVGKVSEQLELTKSCDTDPTQRTKIDDLPETISYSNEITKITGNTDYESSLSISEQFTSLLTEDRYGRKTDEFEIVSYNNARNSMSPEFETIGDSFVHISKPTSALGAGDPFLHVIDLPETEPPSDAASQLSSKLLGDITRYTIVQLETISLSKSLMASSFGMTP